MDPQRRAFSWLAGKVQGSAVAFAESVAWPWGRFLLLLAPLYPGLKWMARVAGGLIGALVVAYIAHGIFSGLWNVNLQVLQPLLRFSLRYPVPVAVGIGLSIALALAAQAGHIREQTQENLRAAFRVYAPVKGLKLKDLETRGEESPFLGTYFPRKLVDETEAGEMDVAMIGEFAEEDLARLLKGNQGFLIVDHSWAGKSLTLFNVLRRMNGYVVVSPDATRQFPSKEVFQLLKGQKVVIALDDLGPVNTKGQFVVYWDYENHRGPISSDRGLFSASARQCEPLQSRSA